VTQLNAAAERYRAAEAAADQARAELHDAILGAVREGVAQREIVDITGYTRERIRQIARAAGIAGG
jgi:uncharacterized protein with gpF-like domain